MPYTIRKSKCKQASGKPGSFTLSYTDKKGKKHRICHTSRKKAKGQIAAIEMPEADCPCDESSSLVESFAYNVLVDLFSSDSAKEFL